MERHNHIVTPGFRANLRLPAFDRFKLKYPDQIASQQEEIRLTNLDERDWFLVTCIQNAINNCCRYMKDPDRDEWRILDNLADTGDCEDFVFTKRALLALAGYSLAAVCPVICTTNIREVPHMVLLIRANGDFIVDNIIPQILPVNQVAYKLKYMLVHNQWQGIVQ